MITVVLEIFGGLLALTAVTCIGMVLSRIGKMERELNRLRSLQTKRMRYDTASGIEDAIAVILGATQDIGEIEIEVDAMMTRLTKAQRILQMVRGGEYDPETPAGPKPRRTRKGPNA